MPVRWHRLPWLIGGWVAVAGTGAERRSQYDSGRTRTGGGVSGGRKWWKCWPEGREPSAGSEHSPRRDAATGKSGDEISHVLYSFRGLGCEDWADSRAGNDPQAESASACRSVTDVAFASQRPEQRIKTGSPCLVLSIPLGTAHVWDPLHNGRPEFADRSALAPWF